MDSPVNAELLRRTLQHIETHPDDWDQASLGCSRPDGSAVADFAGWAVMLADPQARPPAGHRDYRGDWRADEAWVIQGVWAQAHACQLLGLSVTQRQVFFRHDWDLIALRRGVEALCAGQRITARRLRAIMMGDPFS